MSLRCFRPREPLLKWSLPTTKGGAVGGLVALIGVCLLVVAGVLDRVVVPERVSSYVAEVAKALGVAGMGMVAGGGGLVVVALIAHVLLPDSWCLRWYARKRLFAFRFGNPLRFKDGERLPHLSVSRDEGGYWLRVSAISSTPEELVNAQNALSAGMHGRFSDFAVTQIDSDVAGKWVCFRFENVRRDRAISVHSLGDLGTGDVTKLRVQEGLEVDLTSSGSMLAVGVTRSGKTSGVLALLLQIASHGPDAWGSRVVIVDPKMAELSRVSHTVTLDEDGTARSILRAMRGLEELTKKRQSALNEESESSGSPVKWWDLGMHPTVLFIDEFVALRTLFPTRTLKDDGGYNLSEFDASLRRLMTMGASAGVFVIVSIAQASVENIPSMLRRAFSTKFLFRPTLDEARLVWDSSRFESMPQRIYGPGDAWFTSEDGVHDNVTFAHFPVFAPGFGEYRVLGELLTAYEENRRGGPEPLPVEAS